MLSFNTSYVSVQEYISTTCKWWELGRFQYILCFGSRILFLILPVISFAFQYILCFGSSKKAHHQLRNKGAKRFNTSYVSVQDRYLAGGRWPPLSFNTSYVSVQAYKRNAYKERTTVSIHPMFRFKEEKKESIIKSFKKFQYILCFGSSLLAIIPYEFTNYVSIHPMFRFKEDK